MPGRKEDVSMIAIAAPPGWICDSWAAEGLAVEAGDAEEGVRVVGWQCLDPPPCPHQVLEDRGVLLAVVQVLDILD